VLRLLRKRKGEGRLEVAAHEKEDERGGTCQRGREADWAEPAGWPRPKRSGGGVARWADGGGSGLGRGGGREAGWAKGQVGQ
jgi:hypothetical protein